MPDARLARTRQTLPDGYQFGDFSGDGLYIRLALEALYDLLPTPNLTRMYDHDFSGTSPYTPKETQ